MTATALERAAEKPRTSPLPAISLAISALVVLAACIASAILSQRPASAQWMARTWPFVNLIISTGLIIVLISVAKIHAFLALILAAIAAGMMAPVGSLPNEDKLNHWVAAVELSATKFGSTAGAIGIVIVLASIIGMSLLESGAVDKIVRRFLHAFGPKRAGFALLLSTYIVSIPIFFDTIFMLLAPLARALRLRTGKNYILYLMAICCAACITHTMVIPHPGPAAAAASLGIDAGRSIQVGLLTGLVPLAFGWLACLWINRRMNLIPAPMPGTSDEQLQELIDKPEDQLPSFTASLMPIILPVVLIWLASAANMNSIKPWCPTWLRSGLDFLGNRNVALFIGTSLSVGVLMRQRGLSLGQIAERIGPPLETAGIIILITSAGGAFGAMLNSAGIGKAIATATEGRSVNLLFLGFLVSVVMRIAQGSTTVALMTSAGIMAPMITADLPYDPIYIFLAVGYGGLFISWMNDSGFWVIGRLGGLNEKQTLGSWTILTGVIAVTGLLTAWLLSLLVPFPFRFM